MLRKRDVQRVEESDDSSGNSLKPTSLLGLGVNSVIEFVRTILQYSQSRRIREGIDRIRNVCV